jgi:type II secretory pathway component PulK
MLTTLWILTVASVIAMSGALVGRDAIGAGRNRVAAQRAYWRAEGCIARARAAADAALSSAASAADARNVWRRLSTTLAASPLLSACDVRLEAAGTRLDLNAASTDMLTRVLAAAGDVDDPARLAAEIVRARDSAAFADVNDLRRVPTAGATSRFDSLLSVDAGRISLATAPSPVLLAIPGMTPQSAAAVIAARSDSTPLRSLTDILPRLSLSAAESLVAVFPEAERVSTADPDAWLVRSRWRLGLPVITVDVSRRFTRGANGVVATSARIVQ